MANSSNKNATKSLVMLIVTGVVLVAVTLCWFVINKKTTVDNLGSAVNNDASSTAKLFYGVDANNNLAIKRGENNQTGKGIVSNYTEVTGETIKLENMIPGAEYFFKAEFSGCSQDQVLSLVLTNVRTAEENGFDLSKITVYKEITNTSDTVKYANADAQGAPLSNGNFYVYNNAEVQGKVGADKTLIVYFSFKFSIDATVENDMEKTINIDSVDTNLGSGTNN